MRSCKRLGADIHVISMTATPRFSDTERFELTSEDTRHPVLGQRLKAKRFVELRDKGSLVEAGVEMLSNGCVKVAVICNTVRQARRAFDDIKHLRKHLIIGRQRPLDRDRIMKELHPLLQSGAEKSEPMIVVSTHASKPARTSISTAWSRRHVQSTPCDSVWGDLIALALKKKAHAFSLNRKTPSTSLPTARLLALPGAGSRTTPRRSGSISVRGGWKVLQREVPEDARSARPEIVSLLEPHLRMLTRTSSRPRIEPEIDLLLHGNERSPGAVLLVWRQDVGTDNVEAANEILRLLPPDTLEACEVPLWEVLAWLANAPMEADAGDVEGAKIDAPDVVATTEGAIFRWDGSEAGVVLIRPHEMKPGDVVVLPSLTGGYDQHGWNPASDEPVTDIADEVYLARTGRRIERINDPDAEVHGDRIHRWSGGIVVEHFTAERRSRAVPIEVPLSRHCQSVADKARDDGLQLGLDHQVLFDAGLHHDNGKADVGWQLCVNGGNLARLADPPLAKGEYVRSPLSRLPIGWRHEAKSLEMLPRELGNLVRWLVGTHHGHARPFWPIAEHGLGLADLMERLQAEHGYWRLALYEAVLRCADRAVSKAEMGDV